MTAPARMGVLRDPGSLCRRLRLWRDAGDRVAFVPTMGYFHEGHLSLMRHARRRARRVVVSIFVNPTQFAPGEDLGRYPRDLPRDLKLARAEGVDLCFTPEAETLYRPDRRTRVTVEGLDTVLEGASRPGHFDGVALVVLKLLHLVAPDLLVLGQKDAQQAVLLERMIADLDLPVRVLRGRVVREPDGLALSSRNVYLGGEDRAAAAVLHRALRAGRRLALAGERSAGRVLGTVKREIAREPRVELDYVAAVDARTLEPRRRLTGRVLLPGAIRVGGTRLIDNEEFTLPEDHQ